jgi:hypothetical protein
MHDLLFNEGHLDASLEELSRKLAHEVEAAPADHVLSVDEDAWAAALAERWAVTCPTLRTDDMWQDEPQEVQVDVRYDQGRAIFDRSRPVMWPGFRVVVHIPFEGDPGVFKLRPNSFTFNPPRAAIGGSDIVDVIEYPHERPVDIAGQARQLANVIEQWLGWARSQIATYNAGLEQQARAAIANRRQRVEAHQQHVASTGLPVGPPKDRTKTYIADVLVRRPAPVLPDLPESQGIPLEPVLADDVYEHILSVIRGQLVGMERSPTAYENMGEEARRVVVLDALNTHYRGKATAEAFNFQGRTDILIRHDNQNLFIAECKFWTGPKGFADTVDQLFRYRAWRDTKLAIVMFVRERDITALVDKARDTLAAHPQFVRWEDTSHELELRAAVSWPGDDRRHATLTVFLASTPGR